MMQENGKTNDSLVRQVGELWALYDGSRQYRAWKCWLQFQFGVSFFGKGITATAEWPPTSQLGANQFAQWLSNIRDDNDQDTKIKRVGRPVPRRPEPWDGYIPPEPTRSDEPLVTPEFVKAFYERHGMRVVESAAEPRTGKGF